MTRCPRQPGLWWVPSLRFAPLGQWIDQLRIDLETDVNCGARAGHGCYFDKSLGPPNPTPSPQHAEPETAAPVPGLPGLEEAAKLRGAHPDSGVLDRDHNEWLPGQG